MTLFTSNQAFFKSVLAKTFDVSYKCIIIRNLNTAGHKNETQTQISKTLPVEKKEEKAEKLSRAMIAFLEKSAFHENMLKEKEVEFEIGKRHLMKIMSLNENSELDQSQIDKAIQYLLPSNLYDKSAKPFMKPPRNYYPKAKALEFNKEGRPNHYLFYTGQPKLYELFDNVCEKIDRLNKIEDSLRNLKQNTEVITEIKELKSSEWIAPNALAKLIGEKIDYNEYKKFINLMELLVKHPLSNKEKDFVMKYRKEVVSSIKLDFKKEPLIDKNGIPYQEHRSLQRTANVSVRLYEGNGHVEIEAPEGKFDITFFSELKHREQLLYPFKVIDGINKYDVYLTVNNGGMSCISKASRYCISNALCSFIPLDKIEKLRIAGLLTQDRRLKERKKFGQEGARRKFTWKRR